MNDEFLSFINDNVWLKYFLKSTANLNDSGTWIDFEKEIAEVVHDLDTIDITMEYPGKITFRFSNNGASKKLKIFISSFSVHERDYGIVITNNNIVDIKTLIRYIYSHLRNFARAFEIYCLKINKIAIDKSIPTELKKKIENAKDEVKRYKQQVIYEGGNSIRTGGVSDSACKLNSYKNVLASLTSEIKYINYLKVQKFDHILSFNYTNTHEQLYGREKIQYCYIHGKAQEDKSQTNIIFGTDDNLRNGDENKYFKWVQFKKYYQRIIFKTGSEYKNWLNSPAEEKTPQDYVYIAGHSLDRTDYDILFEIFSNTRFKIIIYYYCQDDFEDKIQKVIQLLAYKGGNGRDELIRRVHGEQWSIKFVNQYDEVEGLFINPEL
jgi:hypothetical protein